MRNAAYSFLLLATAAVMFFAGTSQAPRSTVGAAGAAAPRHVRYYVDPMHPAYKSDKPGIAPDCGMALEPVYDDSPVAREDAGSRPSPADVAVTPRQQQLIGVRVEPASLAAGPDPVRLFGRVVADETRVYKVNIGGDGYVRELSPSTTGSHVKKGEWLATVSMPEARQPIQAFVVTLDVLDRESKSPIATPAQIAYARTSMEQAVDRLLTLGMSPVQIEQIRSTREVPADLRIGAPADGLILARNVSNGEKLEKGTELYRVADLRRVWILVDVRAADAALLQPGSAARVMLPNQGAVIQARVSSRVVPQFDPATQSSKVRLEAENPGFLLRPDMFVDVTLEIPRGSAVSVPATAVVMTGLRNTVFVERSAGIFEPREVETGRRFGDRIEIARGLSAGEHIAVSGTFLLDSETRMKRHDRPHH